MLDIGGMKRYMAVGRRREDLVGLPRCQADVTDEAGEKMAKTFLKVTLAEHDKRFHRGGYKEGDSCNFREALKRGDSADELVAAEKKEGDVKVGLIKFRNDEKTGKQVVVGIEEVDKVSVEGEDGESVTVAGVHEDEIAKDSSVERYLNAVSE